MCKTALKWSTVVPERCQIYKSPDGRKCVCLVQMSHWLFRENENCDAKIPCQIKGIKFCTTSRSTFSLVVLIPTLLYKIHSESKMDNLEPTGAGASFRYKSVKFCLSRGSNLKRNKLPKAWPNTDKWGVKWGVKAQYRPFFTTSPQFLLSQLPKCDTLNTSNGIAIASYSIWNCAYLLRGRSVVRVHNLFFAVPLFAYAD